MEAKELLSQANAAMIRRDYKCAIGYYEQLMCRLRIEEQMEVQQNIYRQRIRKIRNILPSSTKKSGANNGDDDDVEEEVAQLKRDLYVGYANAMALCENHDEVPVASAIQVYRQLMVQGGANVDARIMKRLLRIATAALVDRVRRRRVHQRQQKQPLFHSASVHNNHHQVGGGGVNVEGDCGGGDDGSVVTAGNNDLETRAADSEQQQQHQLRNKLADSSDSLVDPLLCGICDDLLKVPVTGPCGHTYCRQCALMLRKCSRCPADQAPSILVVVEDEGEEYEVEGDRGAAAAALNGNGVGLEKDVLISRLVDKWWGLELKAEPRNESARLYLEAGQLDQALLCANESLEQAPNGFTGLLLRSEVLGRLGQFQSSLADAENALRSRPASAKAHYRRADALSGLGLNEAALMAYCIGCAWERSNNIPGAVRHDIARLLHQLMVAPVVNPRQQKQQQQRQRRQWPLTDAGMLLSEDSENRQLSGRWSCTTDGQNREKGSPQIVGDSVVEPFRKRRKLCHSIHELVVSLSDCEEQVGLMAEQYERQQRKRRRKGSDRVRTKGHRDVFNRIRHYSYSSSDPTDDDAFTIDEKAMARAALPEMNLFEQDHEGVVVVVEEEEEEEDDVKSVGDELMALPLTDVNDLLERIFTAVDSSKDATVYVNKSLIEPSDFDCVLCYRPLWRPVVTPCGHTYCSICLDRCMDYRQQCPLCMSPIADALSLTKHNATLFLETAMERFIPELCGRRQLPETEPAVPIFICTAAFPNVPCPLLVSEPRYRLMVRQAIESGERQFGMTHLIGVPTTSGRQQYSEYGTMLDIRDCVLLENGWSILSTVGSRRFRVVAKGERDGYDTAKVEFICDSPIGKEKVKQMTKLHEEVFFKAICWFDSLSETYKTEIVKSFGRMPQPEDSWISITDGPAWTWWIIAILPLNQQLKGKIIAEINLEKRLKAIDKTLFTLQCSTRNGQRMRHAAGAGSHAATTGAYAVNEVAVSQDTIDCCQRTLSVAGGSSTRVQLEDMPGPNQSTQFLL